MLRSLIVLIYFFSSYFIMSENKKSEEIIVSASIGQTLKEYSPSSVVVITSKELELYKGLSLSEILKSKSGLQILQTGGRNSSSYFVRGFDSEDVLFLLDGMAINDPSTPSRQFSWSQLDLSAIERIEIVKGPQSGIYGSDAFAGVINIVSKKETAHSFRTVTGLDSLFSLAQNVAINKNVNNWHFHSEFNYVKSEGFKTSKSNYKSDKDGFEDLQINFQTNWNLYKNQTFKLHYLYTLLSQDLDDSSFQSDSNRTFKQQKNLLNLEWQQNSAFQGYTITTSYHQGESEDRDIDNGIYSFNTNIFFDVLQLKWVHDYNWNKDHQSLYGYHFLNESFNMNENGSFPFRVEETSSTTHSLFFEQKDLWGRRFLSQLNSRLDKQNSNNENFSFKLMLGVLLDYKLSNVKLSYSKGVKHPSLSQLYGAFGANPNLKGENVNSWDLQTDWKLNQQWNMNISGYFNQVYNAIEYTTAYTNQEKRNWMGMEFVITNKRPKTLFSLNYSYLENRDSSKEMLRRAKHSGGSQFTYLLSERFKFHYSLTFIGERKDKDFSNFPNKLITLKSYTVHDFIISFQQNLSSSWTISLLNAFNNNYQPVYGYNSQPLTVKVLWQHKFL